MNRARIVKADSQNYGIEVYREVENKKEKTKRMEWATEKYYGTRLDWAARAAVFYAFEPGEVVTEAMINQAAEMIVKETQAVLK